MAKLMGVAAVVLFATAIGIAQVGDLKGKVVIAGTGPQLETSIDIIAAALDQRGVPYKVVGESPRRVENDKMAENGALSLLYLNQEIVLKSRPKLVATCYDAKGTVLWQEETNASFTMTQVGSAKTLAGRIAKKISDPGFGGACFPSR
jgi:hypothetical protein